MSLYNASYKEKIYLTCDIEFGMDIQASHVASQKHVNIVTTDELFMFTSENHVNTMTSGVCTECKSLGVGPCGRPQCSALFQKFDRKNNKNYIFWQHNNIFV